MPPDQPHDADKTVIAEVEEKESYPCLRLLSGAGRGTRYPLHSGANILGRGDNADVHLEDSSVSREHAELDVRQDGALARDLGSRNGTRVGGKKISEQVPVTHGGRLKVGIYDLQYLTEDLPIPPEDNLEIENEEEMPSEEKETVGEGETSVPATVPESGPPTAGPPTAGPPTADLSDVPAEIPTPPVKRPSRKWLLAASSAVVLLVIFLIGYVGFKKVTSYKPPEILTDGGDGEELKATTGTVKVPKPEYVPVFLDFSSTPVTSDIYFGDEKVGSAPFRMSVNLQYGKTYEVRAIFHLEEVGENLEERLRFSLASDQQVIPINFTGKIGHLKIRSLPPGVEMYLEGTYDHDPHVAKPIKFNEIIFGKPVYLPYGSYVLELKASRQLASSNTFISEVVYKRSFRIDARNGTFEVGVSEKDLKLFPANIVSKPDGADLLVDGVKVGVTPFTGEILQGEHTLVLRKEGYFEYKQPIRIEVNLPFDLEITLKTSEAGSFINEARVMIRGKRYKEAIEALVNALKKNPTKLEVAEINYLIGQSYLYLSSYNEARDHFTQAHSHEEFRHPARLGIAQIYFNSGERIKALQVLVEVLISAKSDEVRSEAAKLFQQISPFKSVLYITSKPEGAKVVVNDKEVAVNTPLILHDLMVGIYRLSFSLPGYETMTMKVDLGVSEFKPVVAELNPTQPAGQ